MPESTLQDAASHIAALDAIDRRQDEILGQLDELNDRILRVLTENGVTPPKLPPPFSANEIRAEKAAA